MNKELDLAWNFVVNTNKNIFLTGKAGTGKTTFLHKLKLQSTKRMVVVAPTGVAAINAKGVTIHSFFQLPFGPILPNANLNNTSGFVRKFNKTKINIIKSLDLLVIDEISMVRADLLDGIDKTLKRYKNKNLPFGGVQLLMIGDLQQLSPVVKDFEWQLLKPYYKNAFFFSSLAYQHSQAITIELKHIYRQDDPMFINILNEIRNNNLSEASAKQLNKRYKPNFVPNATDGYISLTTHNNKVTQSNIAELDKLTGKSKTYKAKIEGNFPEHTYPNKSELILKVGAQVMFIKNDSLPEKRYYNGKIGTVISLDSDEVVVNCVGDNFNINAKAELWENITYKVDATTKAITENKIGSYTQIPLRLAWAITIHKSQGLTFKNAIIDAQGAFAHGQTYVALSRCKSLEGLVLRSKIEPNQIISDANVMAFNANAEANPPNETLLRQAKRDFQLDLIAELFDFYEFLYPINRILDVFYKNKERIKGNIDTVLTNLTESLKNLLKVSTSFNIQLQSMCGCNDNPETNTSLQNRFVKAISYFNTQTQSTLQHALKQINFTTDNKTIESDIEKQLDSLELVIATKLAYFNNLKDGFNTSQFLDLRAKSVFLTKDKPKTPHNTVANDLTHKALYEALRLLRNEIASRDDLVHYQVFPQKALYAMCEQLPTSMHELINVHGMGKTRIEKYGTQIITTITKYCDANGITIAKPLVNVLKPNNPKKPKRQLGQTNLLSLDLFKTGKSIAQIALERALTVNTIFGHLASFVPTGEVKITDLMSKTHYVALKNTIPKTTFKGVSDLKQQLDDKYSYNEIKLVLESLS